MFTSLLPRFALVASLLGMTACTPQPPKESAAASQSSATAPTNGKPHKTIAISAIVVHPSLDAIRQGIIDELAAEGYIKGQNLTVNFQSAQGNTATAGQISKQFVAEKPDVIVAISTPTAQSLAPAAHRLRLHRADGACSSHRPRRELGRLHDAPHYQLVLPGRAGAHEAL